ncbi:hypothetical protein [Microbacterium sp. NPDC055599]
MTKNIPSRRRPFEADDVSLTAGRREADALVRSERDVSVRELLATGGLRAAREVFG